MNNKPNILYCYSQQEFDELMKNLGWSQPSDNFSTVSICSPWNEGFEHWFNSDTPNNCNINCDDVVRPFWWDKDYYDEALELYLNGKIEESNKFFIYKDENNELKMFNYEQAFLLADWINTQIIHGYDNFYVHCAAGMSRSQAVIKYILCTYPEYNWKIREENPPVYHNNHMLLMLKRAARNIGII